MLAYSREVGLQYPGHPLVTADVATFSRGFDMRCEPDVKRVLRILSARDGKQRVSNIVRTQVLWNNVIFNLFVYLELE